MSTAAAPARELKVVQTNCRWYGMSNATGRLTPTGSNGCGLQPESSSPCQMERNGNPIDETRCPLVRLALEAAGVPIEETK